MSKQPNPTSPNQQPQQSQQPIPAKGHMSPGDQAPAGTPGTGENICPHCGGSGRKDGNPCPNCEGTGTIITGIGGA